MMYFKVERLMDKLGAIMIAKSSTKEERRRAADYYDELLELCNLLEEYELESDFSGVSSKKMETLISNTDEILISREIEGNYVNVVRITSLDALFECGDSVYENTKIEFFVSLAPMTAVLEKRK